MLDEGPARHCSEDRFLHSNRCPGGEGWPDAPRLQPQGRSEVWLLGHARDHDHGLEAQTTTGQCLIARMGAV